METICKWLHEFPGVRVEHDVMMPTADGESERQVDVLLIFDGLPEEQRYIVIECKNYGAQIKPAIIDSFVGMLRDVGVPCRRGIFVSVEGYTKDAQRRARHEGITLLKLGGLTKDRLKQEVFLALQSVVYILADFDEYHIVYDEPEPSAPRGYARIISLDESMGFFDHKGRVGNLGDFLWAASVDGTIRPTIGTHHILLELPSDCYSIKDGEAVPVKIATCRLMIAGYVHTIEGKAKQNTLVNVESNALDKFGTELSFDRFEGTHVLKLERTERELQDLIEAQGVTHVVSRVQVPRIRFWHMAYWPQSERAGRVVSERMNAFWEGRAADPRPFIWADLEGHDIATAWEPIDAAYWLNRPVETIPVKLQDSCVPDTLEMEAQ